MQILNDAVRRGFPIFLVGVCVAAAPACSASDDPGTSGGRGGSGATAGTGPDGSAGLGGGGVGGASTGTAGRGGTGGEGGSAGAAGKGGTGGAAGAGATGGKGGAGGTATEGGAGATEGGATEGGATEGGAREGGAADTAIVTDSGRDSDSAIDTGGDRTSSEGGTADSGARFSFFVTSLVAMRALSGNQNGFGGDLRFGQATGLAGADEICRQTAERSMPGNGKTWRAFLSTAAGPVNAIDRIGTGPWYDRNGRLVAMSKADLAMTRPAGADPVILNDLPNESGVPNHNPDGTGDVDHHDILTGSTATGTLHTSGVAGTCQDWTSLGAGAPLIGHSWPASSGMSWSSSHTVPSCAAGVLGAAGQHVGSLGGYGGIYCFALTP